ncbi:MAG: response regulator [Gammaproteobacteria bacterium]|nr:response regulator [Gammaproteobacteria bacterium]
MKQVLFVDDDAGILDGLKRLLRRMRHRWQMEFVVDPHAALKLIESGKFDVVVSDMQMPEVSGVEILRHAKQYSPQAVRVALSDYAEAEMVLEAAGVIHQFLAKPCDAEHLIECVDEVIRLQDRLQSAQVQKTVSRISSLPTLPDIYMRVMAEASAPDGTLQGVAEIVASDPSITTKLLQIVNSAYFGMRTTVNSPTQAVSLLGLDAVRSLVLAIEVFRSFEGKSAQAGLQALWSRSLLMGSLAKQTATALAFDRKQIEQASLSGMLADVGMLVLLSEFPEPNQSIAALIKDGVEPLAAEVQVLGCTHMDLGAYLLTLWGLPRGVIEAIAYHHQPSASIGDRASTLTAVHLAEVIAQCGAAGCAPATLLDTAYLARIGMEQRAGTIIDDLSRTQFSNTG